MDAAASARDRIAGRDKLRERSPDVLTSEPKRTVKSCGPDSLWVGVKSRGGEAAQPGVRPAINPRGDGDNQILIAGVSTYKP